MRIMGDFKPKQDSHKLYKKKKDEFSLHLIIFVGKKMS